VAYPNLLVRYRLRIRIRIRIVVVRIRPAPNGPQLSRVMRRGSGTRSQKSHCQDEGYGVRKECAPEEIRQRIVDLSVVSEGEEPGLSSDEARGRGRLVMTQRPQKITFGEMREMGVC